MCLSAVEYSRRWGGARTRGVDLLAWGWTFVVELGWGGLGREGGHRPGVARCSVDEGPSGIGSRRVGGVGRSCRRWWFGGPAIGDSMTPVSSSCANLVAMARGVVDQSDTPTAGRRIQHRERVDARKGAKCRIHAADPFAALCGWFADPFQRAAVRRSELPTSRFSIDFSGRSRAVERPRSGASEIRGGATSPALPRPGSPRAPRQWESTRRARASPRTPDVEEPPHS